MSTEAARLIDISDHVPIEGGEHLVVFRGIDLVKDVSSRTIDAAEIVVSKMGYATPTPTYAASLVSACTISDLAKIGMNTLVIAHTPLYFGGSRRVLGFSFHKGIKWVYAYHAPPGHSWDWKVGFVFFEPALRS